MLYYNTKNITKNKFDTILKNLENYQSIPIYLGKRTINGSKFDSFVFTDENRKLIVGYVNIKSGSIVDYNNPKQEECDAVVLYENEAFIIPQDEIEESSIFPDLKQSFYENNDYREREADYKYYFDDGETLIAKNSANPISRQEDITIKAIEYLGGNFPQSWLLQTKEDNYYYLRERSGSIRLIDGLDSDSELIFHAFIGREHPGTYLKEHEVIKIISSMDYINIIDDYDKEVPEEAHDEYWGDYLDNIDNITNIFDEISDS